MPANPAQAYLNHAYQLVPSSAARENPTASSLIAESAKITEEVSISSQAKAFFAAKQLTELEIPKLKMLELKPR